MCSWQSPTHGWCLRPKVLFLREVTATAARMTLAALVCTFTEAIKHCPPTNTASSMTSTATTLTPGHGKSRHAHTHTNASSLVTLDTLWHACVPGSFWKRAASRGTCTQRCSSAAPCSSSAATRTTTRHSATGPSVSLLTSLPMTSVGLVLLLTSRHSLNGDLCSGFY